MRLHVVLVVLAVLTACVVDAKKAKKSKKEKVLEEDFEEVSVRSHNHIVRPRYMQMYSKYDKCKMECEKLKEQEDLSTYVTQLREEIAAAEALFDEENEMGGHLDWEKPADELSLETDTVADPEPLSHK